MGWKEMNKVTLRRDIPPIWALGNRRSGIGRRVMRDHRMIEVIIEEIDTVFSVQALFQVTIFLLSDWKGCCTIVLDYTTWKSRYF